MFGLMQNNLIYNISDTHTFLCQLCTNSLKLAKINLVKHTNFNIWNKPDWLYFFKGNEYDDIYLKSAV
jgi:hypothetical protein